MAQGWNIGLDVLTVDNADEDNFLSDGDDIYIAIVAFRSKLGVAGSTSTWLNGWNTYQWAKHVKQGAKRGLPANVGRMAFANVDTIGLNEVVSAKQEPTNPAFKPEVLGIISLAFESDDTSWGTMSGIIDNIRTTVHDEIEKIVAGETTPIDKLTAAQLTDKLKASAGHIKDAITPSLLGKLKILLSSAGDPDDFIDYKVNWFTNLDPGLVTCFEGLKESKDAASGTPKPADQSAEGLITRSGLNPLRSFNFNNVYHKSGVQYSVTGSVHH